MLLIAFLFRDRGGHSPTRDSAFLILLVTGIKSSIQWRNKSRGGRSLRDCVLTTFHYKILKELGTCMVIAKYLNLGHVGKAVNFMLKIQLMPPSP